jgi:hypothetical protein
VGTSYILTVEGNIMNDEIDIFFDKSDGSTYLESLIRSMVYNEDSEIASGLKSVVLLEIELARLGAEKAISEAKQAALKEVSGANVRPIK